MLRSMENNKIVNTEDIKQKALELGFDLVGITSAEPLGYEQTRRYEDWINSGFAAGMSYMRKNIAERFNPASLLAGARSIIVAAINYKPSLLKVGPKEGVAAGCVASCACYEDYHVFIEKLLLELAEFIVSTFDGEMKFKICAGTAPLAEKALAERAGLGFIGKNKLLINPHLGPQILLGEIITTLKLQGDEPLSADCGSCRKCIGACPTGALREDGKLDAGRCISYLTVEHKTDIPCDLAALMGNHIFGCDECILCCPYQQKSPYCKNKDFRFFSERGNLDLNEILKMNEESFARRFCDSPLLRTGLVRLQRNAAICLENLTTGRAES